MEVYEVIVTDEWNNYYSQGFYKDLSDPELLEGINSFFKDKVLINDEEERIENFELKPGDLVKYPSTFGYCFDREFSFEDGEYVRVFGFIYDLDELVKTLESLKKENV